MTYTRLNRRDFFKLSGASAAALIVGSTVMGCDATAGIGNSVDPAENEGVSAGVPINFSKEVDVLIVGSGIAGLSAAIEPSEAGHSVIVADKLDVLGGESYTSTGLFFVSGTDIQKNAGITTSIDDAWAKRSSELLANGFGPDLSFEKTLFSTQTDWVNRIVSDYGAKFSDPKDYVDKGSPDSFLIPKNGITELSTVMTPLKEKLAAQGVVFELGQRAIDFILDGSSAVVGMRFYVESTASVKDIKAKTIIIATGGFACNQEMVRDNLPAHAALACYTTYASGEGQILSSSLKGQLANMDKIPPLTSDIPQIDTWGQFGPIVNVDPQGKRIASEDTIGATADACASEELGFWWTIFDKQLSDNGQSKSVSYVNGQYPKRIVGPYDSLEDLARGINISPENLQSTFDGYNNSVDENKDEAFEKTVFLQKVNAPYYAVKQFPNRFKTLGGAATNEKAQLLGANGTVIEAVYYCGACASRSFNGLPSHGAYGLIAGRSVVEALQEDISKTEP